MEWTTRVRYWPQQDIVKQVVAGGSELVPKVGLVNDQFRWSLSFSQSEYLLALQIGPKPRS